MVIHSLKTDPKVFELSISGKKNYELRLNDRGFKVGQTVHLNETVYSADEMHDLGCDVEYSGRHLFADIVSIVDGYGLQDGWVILGLEFK